VGDERRTKVISRNPKAVSGEFGHATTRMIVDVYDSFLDPAMWPPAEEIGRLAEVYGWEGAARALTMPSPTPLLSDRERLGVITEAKLRRSYTGQRAGHFKKVHQGPLDALGARDSLLRREPSAHPAHRRETGHETKGLDPEQAAGSRERLDHPAGPGGVDDR